MAEVLDQLVPIQEIVGPAGVKAKYSDHTIWDRDRGAYTPGWTIEIDGTYKGASIRMSQESRSLDDAATNLLRRLRAALGLTP